ncbi:MAG: DegT/DnrJ/EryC1/StrS family aminotransferase [Chloroflexota bacterium]|nr:DegT/DnrJ/EryC1/StrS family aminotransferase [Chloroflexota bacterium]
MTSGYVVPMSSPDLTAADVEAVRSVLAPRYLSIGPQMEAFEQGLASYIGARYAAGVNSGASSLHLAV